MATSRLDMIVRGLNRGSGRSLDRFQARCPDGMAPVYKGMVKELATRIGGLDLLRACVDGRFGIDELHRAYVQGAAALDALSRERKHPPLRELAETFFTEHGIATVEDTRQRVEAFLDTLPEDAPATAFTTQAVAAFLATLSSRKNSTRNRYRASIQSFSTWLVGRGVLPSCPISRKIKALRENKRRLPDMTPEEYKAYFAAIEAYNPAAVLAFKVLIHTGADVGEVLTMRVLDCELERKLPRIRFKRSKTDTRERLVPVPADVALALQNRIAQAKLKPADLVFGDLSDGVLRGAHGDAREKIKRPTLTRKDLRHIAAIYWRRAGVDLERIREWLGHTNISQTAIYAAFGADDEWDAPAVNRAGTLLTLVKGEKVA